MSNSRVIPDSGTQRFAPRERLDGEIVVITGGSGAIGAAAARRAAALGATVVIVCRGDRSRAEAVLASLPGRHGIVQGDVTDSASLARAALSVCESWGNASVLINCAGLTYPVPATDLAALNDDLIDQMFAVNWRGTFAAIRAFAPQMRAVGEAVVVNVSSIAAFTGMGSNLAYAAAKAATDALTKALAKSLAPQIRCLAISPGIVATSFVPGRDAGFNAKAAATIPLGRVGTAEDVAAAILACCTSLCYATGSIIVVDGGRHLSQ